MIKFDVDDNNVKSNEAEGWEEGCFSCQGVSCRVKYELLQHEIEPRLDYEKHTCFKG